eukprot:m.158898 g.158898  ORF g.158898 m.158898 type:complete len:83 (-) comp16342_c0_seq1:235-483(-)
MLTCKRNNNYSRKARQHSYAQCLLSRKADPCDAAAFLGSVRGGGGWWCGKDPTVCSQPALPPILVRTIYGERDSVQQVVPPG